MNKVEIGEAGAVSLSLCPLDPFADDVDPDAEFGWVRVGIGRKEMAVSTADLPGEPSVRCEDLGVTRAQVASSRRHQFKILGGAGGIFHGKRGASVGRSDDRITPLPYPLG